MRNQLGIDLGSANLVAAASGEGVVVQEPSVVALSKTDGSIVAVGKAAEHKLNIRDTQVTGSRPFGSGVADNPDITREVLRGCLTSCGYNHLLSGDLLFSVPCNFTAEEESVLLTVSEELGVRSCYFMYAPLAAMVGSYEKLPPAFLAVDIGASRTNVILVCRGKIYYIKTIEDAGETIDRSIVEYVWQKRKVHISLRVAEEIKMRIASVWTSREGLTMDVTGRDTNNRSVTVTVSSSELYEALESPMGNILEAICVAVSKVPVHSVKSVFDTGICLMGGGACLDGVEKMISAVTGVKVHRVDDPLTATANGLGIAFDILPLELPKNMHNVSEYVMKRLYSTK